MSCSPMRHLQNEACLKQNIFIGCSCHCLYAVGSEERGMFPPEHIYPSTAQSNLSGIELQEGINGSNTLFVFISASWSALYTNKCCWFQVLFDAIVSISFLFFISACLYACLPLLVCLMAVAADVVLLFPCHMLDFGLCMLWLFMLRASLDFLKSFLHSYMLACQVLVCFLFCFCDDLFGCYGEHPLKQPSHVHQTRATRHASACLLVKQTTPQHTWLHLSAIALTMLVFLVQTNMPAHLQQPTALQCCSHLNGREHH